MAAVVLCGCIRDHIEVTIEPRPDGSFVRTIRLWQTDSEKKGQILAPRGELAAHAAKHYLERLEGGGPAVRLKGTFYTVPADITRDGTTNRGAYTVWRSRLGYVAYYRERRPGRIDLAARFDEARPALDLLAKVAVTIARQQLEGEAGLDRLVAWLEGPFRRDLKEIAFYCYLARIGPIGRAKPHGKDDGDGMMGALVLALQYAEERGILKATDIPKFDDDKARGELLMGIVAKRMGRPLDDALRKKLALLADEDLAQAAFEKALKALKMTEEQFQKAMDRLNNIVLGFEIFAEPDPELRYILRLPPGTDVLQTSGRHDERAAQITWAGTLDNCPVADLFYALCAVPDAAWQTRHLGRVVLRRDALRNYVLWESGLRPKRAAAWRAALDRLDPRGDLKKQLGAIQLTLPLPAKKPSPERGATTIINALERPEEE